MASSDAERLSVVIPVYNERDNVEPLVRGLEEVQRAWGRTLEAVVVDDRSPDGTGELFARLGSSYGVSTRVVERTGTRSLGRAIVEGIGLSRGGLVGVMDADLSHPPRTILEMLRALDGADGVVASRYAPGGRIASWPVRRRVVSRMATALARQLVLCPSTDPVSGFFLFRRSALEGLTLTGLGNKPLVEILAQRPLVIHEVPYEFRDRERGASKLDPRAIVAFAQLLFRLSWASAGKRAEATPDQSHATSEAQDP